MAPQAPVKLHYNPSSVLLSELLKQCPSLQPGAQYRPAPWLPSPHLQTVWSTLDPTAPHIRYRRQLITTPDGGTSAIDWAEAVVPGPTEHLAAASDDPAPAVLPEAHARSSAAAGLGSTAAVDAASGPGAASGTGISQQPAAAGGAGSESAAPAARAVPAACTAGGTADQPTPVLLLVPGLTGTSNAAYIRHMVGAALAQGWRCGVVNHRGLGGVALTSSHVYSAGFTGDLRKAVEVAAAARPPPAPLLLGGFSLGGNVLAKFLAEEGERCPAAAAFCLSNPFDLVACDEYMRGPLVNRLVYARALARNLQRATRLHDPRHLEDRIDFDGVRAARNVREFDEAFTRRMFGYASVDDYYQDASSAPRLPKVAIPLLALNAEDDPIIPGSALPYAQALAAPHVLLATTQLGGHVAHFEGMRRATCWWLKPVTEFLAAAVRQQQGEKGGEH